jgi:hypothetical protein
MPENAIQIYLIFLLIINQKYNVKICLGVATIYVEGKFRDFGLYLKYLNK